MTGVRADAEMVGNTSTTTTSTASTAAASTAAWSVGTVTVSASMFVMPPNCQIGVDLREPATVLVWRTCLPPDEGHCLSDPLLLPMAPLSRRDLDSLLGTYRRL